MNELLPILLAALAVTLGMWTLVQAVLWFASGERKRIAKRLGAGWQPPNESARDSGLHRPIVRQDDDRDIPRFLANFRIIRSIDKKLVYAYPDASLQRFLMVTVALALLGAVFGWLLTLTSTAAIVAGAIVGYMPMAFLRAKASRRQRTLTSQIPDALDFLGRILRAGHSLSTGLQMLGEEMPEPIATEFRRCHDQAALGQSVDEALRAASKRIDSTDFAFFVTAVLVQRQTGGDLSAVLHNISAMIRARVRLQQHVKAITAEGRLTGNILIAFPAILFAITFLLNPAYAGVLLRTDTGRYMLGGAVMLQIIGLFAIRKIVTVKA